MSHPLRGKKFLGLLSDPGFHRTTDLSGYFAIPAHPHKGSFAFERKNHTHEGIDIYCNEGDEIVSMTDGTVESVLPFTGPAAGFPWWLDTEGVAVRTDSGILVIYGEIRAAVKPGTRLLEGDTVGFSIPVLRDPKGYPACMLHVETYSKDASWSCGIWLPGEPRPPFLLDPVPLVTEWIARACDDRETPRREPPAP